MQEQSQRVSAGHQAAHEALQSSHQESGYSPQSDRYEVTLSAGGAEEFDARAVREEERPELENLVVLDQGLRQRGACSAQTGDEECIEQEAADRRDESADFGVTNEMDQELQHFLISRTEGEALEVVRGAEREEQRRSLAALHDP